jgi:hypothetical protein
VYALRGVEGGAGARACCTDVLSHNEGGPRSRHCLQCPDFALLVLQGFGSIAVFDVFGGGLSVAVVSPGVDIA